MSFNRNKSTKRFNFSVSRNTSHRAGSNTLRIVSNGTVGGRYSTDTGISKGDGITMTIKEANALRGFLNSYLDGGGTDTGTDTGTGTGTDTNN